MHTQSKKRKSRIASHFAMMTAGAAFTLIELLVVISVIAILAGLILPTLGKAKIRGYSAACLSNVKQVQLSWQMYVDEHDGRVPPNTAAWTNGAWRSTVDSWAGPSSAPHDVDTGNLEQGSLPGQYSRSAKIYHCPADKSNVQPLDGLGSGLLRSRSYAMNGNLGGRTNELQIAIQHADQILEPSRVFVFIDEHEDSIDDGHFLVWAFPDDRWINLPADRHAQGCNLSFADGHVEYWKWRSPKIFQPKQNFWKQADGEADLADLRRLQQAILSLP